MEKEIKAFMKDIKPTRIGVILLMIMFVIFPFCIDLIIDITNPKIRNGFSLTVFLVQGFIAILFLTFIYLIGYFFIKTIVKKLTKPTTYGLS
jgi:uncharacterized membrane protein